MNMGVKLVIISVIISFASISYPLSESNIVWVDDKNFSFFIQVLLPRVGLIAGSMIGGYAGVTILRSSNTQELTDHVIPMSLIGFALLIAGIFIGGAGFSAYIYVYTLTCPVLIGFGTTKFEGIIRAKTSLLYVYMGGVAVISLILLAVGITSYDWIMIFDLATSMRVLCAALLGSFLKLRR